MNHLKNLQNKIHSHESLMAKINSWRASGCKIVFTNGCFDILHLGHIDYLAQAADFGTKMIVALNTDASVARIKGPTRPICDQLSRSMVMASLEFVSAVTFFDEATPYDLIKMVQPDILVKGADYRAEDIVGYDIVIARGGSVETIPLVKGYSTTAIETKIRVSKT
jgi:D-glycero-beta-D-manno-heptose 1-phosphate adenylyltransferase